MTARPDLESRLRAARPADPSGDDLHAASVRVLARVAMLETGRRADPAPARRRQLRRAAGVAAAAVALVLLGSRVLTPVPTAPSIAPTEARTPAWILAALGGDPLARQTALAGGPAARLALLEHAEAVPADAEASLALVRAAGGLRSDEEVHRVHRLALRAGTRARAVDLLAAATGSAGLAGLERLLVETPPAEALVVDALVALAAGGRRGPVFDALVAGAAAGRTRAAAEALRLATGRRLERLLAVLDSSAVREPPVIVGVRDAPATVRDRLVRLAREGDVRALRLVVEARLDPAVDLLGERALSDDAATARVAIGDLVRQHRADAWMAVARVLDAPHADEARGALARAPRWAVSHLERTAREVVPDRRFALAGLAAAGEPGLLALERLSERPVLRGPVIDVLTDAEGGGATAVLASMLDTGRETDRILVALARRLEAGDDGAGRALLARVRTSDSRSALRLLLRHADHVHGDWLEEAAGDANLPSAVRASIERALRRLREADDPAGSKETRPSSVA